LNRSKRNSVERSSVVRSSVECSKTSVERSRTQQFVLQNKNNESNLKLDKITEEKQETSLNWKREKRFIYLESINCTKRREKKFRVQRELKSGETIQISLDKNMIQP